MWEERDPLRGETVKIQFADWTNLGTKIGIYLGRFYDRDKIQFGDCIRFLESGQTFVWNSKFV